MRTGIYFLFIILSIFSTHVQAHTNNFVLTQSGNDAILLKSKGTQLSIFYNQNIDKGILRAINDLRDDFERVTGEKPSLTTNAVANKTPHIIVGTINTK